VMDIPCMVQIEDYCLDEDSIYILIKRVEGCQLKDIFKAKRNALIDQSKISYQDMKNYSAFLLTLFTKLLESFLILKKTDQSIFSSINLENVLLSFEKQHFYEIGILNQYDLL